MRIEHAALYVRDLEQAKEFFCKYFSASSNESYHNKNTDFRSCFLSFENGARLELMHKPLLTEAGSSRSRYGYAHIAFSTGSKAAVDSLTRLLMEDGYTVVSGPRTTGDGYYESCIVDLEGNLIEITE